LAAKGSHDRLADEDLPLAPGRLRLAENELAVYPLEAGADLKGRLLEVNIAPAQAANFSRA
jgi:hypothetical protein